MKKKEAWKINCLKGSFYVMGWIIQEGGQESSLSSMQSPILLGEWGGGVSFYHFVKNSIFIPVDYKKYFKKQNSIGWCINSLQEGGDFIPKDEKGNVLFSDVDFIETWKVQIDALLYIENSQMKYCLSGTPYQLFAVCEMNMKIFFAGDGRLRWWRTCKIHRFIKLQQRTN